MTTQKTDNISVLTALTEKINDYEIKRDDDAAKFFNEYLHHGLRFKRANDFWISKTEFITSLKEKDPFQSRKIEDINVHQLDTTCAIVSCVIICKKSNEEKEYKYRNIRIFKQDNDKWLLHGWYNYEIE